MVEMRNITLENKKGHVSIKYNKTIFRRKYKFEVNHSSSRITN